MAAGARHRLDRNAEARPDRRAAGAPPSVAPADARPLLGLQRAIGNRGVVGQLAARPPSRVEPVTVRRLMSADAFAGLTELDTDSSAFSKGRNKVTGVDDALTAYNAVDFSDPDDKLTRLDALITQCSQYLARDDKKAKRKTGVQSLLDEAVYERPFVAEGRAAVKQGGLAAVRELIKVQDRVVAEIRQGRALDALNADLADAVSILTNRLSAPDKKQLMLDDVATLQAMSLDTSLPAVTRAILREVVANLNKIDLTTGPAGAGFVPQGNTSGKDYFVMNNTKRAQGSAERLGALTHELTHVSVSESYENSKMMWSFAADMPEDQVLKLSQRRVGQLDRLLALIDGVPALLPAQKQLVRGQLEYAKRPNLQAEKTSLTDQEVAKFARLESAGVNWSAMVEFDTNVNQCLLFMGQWGVDQANAFYRLLIAVAREAFNQRAFARRS